MDFTRVAIDFVDILRWDNIPVISRLFTVPIIRLFTFL